MSLTLEEAAALAGHHLWWEARLFELTGAWAVADHRPAVTVALAGQASRHADRTEAWHRRLPVLAGWDASTLTVAPGDPLVEELATLASADAGARLDALYRRILPARLVAYRAHLEQTSPVCDAPARRVLHAILAAMPAEIEVGLGLLSA